MDRSFWVRVVNTDKGKKYPEQQCEGMDRVGDYIIVSPYGLWCKLPTDTLARVMGDGAAASVNQKRPSDLDDGEPVFFHPPTNTRLILRNSGVVDLITGENGDAPVNIICTSVNINASEMVNIDSPLVNMTGELRVEKGVTANYGTPNSVGVGSHRHTQNNDSAGNVEQPTNSPIAGT